MTIQEKVARAMWADTDDTPMMGWDNIEDITRRIYRSNATVAITIFLEAAAEQGWQMWPDEATEEMQDSGANQSWDGNEDWPEHIYRAMLAAAPEFEWGK